MRGAQVHSTAEPAGQAFPSQGVLLDLAGRPVDASSWSWRLNSATVRTMLNWRRVKFQTPALLQAAVQFCAELVRYRSPASVSGWFDEICYFSEFMQASGDDVAGAVIGFSCFSAWMEKRGKDGRYRVRLLRDWYAWCCDRGYE